MKASNELIRHTKFQGKIPHPSKTNHYLAAKSFVVFVTAARKTKNWFLHADVPAVLSMLTRVVCCRGLSWKMIRYVSCASVKWMWRKLDLNPSHRYRQVWLCIVPICFRVTVSISAFACLLTWLSLFFFEMFHWLIRPTDQPIVVRWLANGLADWITDSLNR